MPNGAYLKSKEYWHRMGWGLLVALLGAVGAFIFLALMNLGISIVWPQPQSIVPFSGSWRIAAIMTTAGLIVGLFHRFTSAEEINVFAAVTKGRLDPRPVPGGLLVALTSLIGGFSVGPEVPSGMLAGGLGTWLSERRKLSDEVKKTNVMSGVQAAYGGLFTTLSMVLMPLELPHRQTPAFFGTLFIATLSTVVGFLLFFTEAGQEYADTLRLLDLPTYDLQTWHFVVAIVLAVVGAIVGMLYGITKHLLTLLAAPLENRPIIRCTLTGFLMGLLGMALPLTRGLGTEGLVIVTENAAQIGVTLLIILALAKLLALAGALAAGFIGGPIFPLFFVGGTLGVAVNLMFPDVPVALAVGCLMAAIASAGAPVPFTLSVIVLLIVGLPATEAIPVILAGVTAHVLTHGLGLVPSPKEADQPAESTATSTA